MTNLQQGPEALAFTVDVPLVGRSRTVPAGGLHSPSFDAAEMRAERALATMDLILWRHAEAEPGAPEDSRRLTAKGQRHAERVGAWLEQRLPEGARILVSPARCAQQTAFALQRKFKTSDAVGPGAPVESLLAAAGWPDAGRPVVVVGHQPALGSVASLLLSGEQLAWTVRKCALWWLSNRKRGGTSGVMLRAMLGPDVA